MKKFDFEQPEFFFCEVPVKDGTQNDDRIWIYHRLSLSLIEFVNVDEFTDFQFSGKQSRFEYENGDGLVENWFGVFVQNNCEVTDNNDDDVIKRCWRYLESYFMWTDTQD